MNAFPSQQALDMLVEDHRRVQALFRQFDKADDDATREDIVRAACREITIHAAIEEELFYPAVQHEIKDPDLVDEATVEHASARQLIEQIGTMRPEDALFEATFRVLGEYLNHHIGEEEDTLFAEVRRTRLDLHTLGVAMHERRAQLDATLAAAEEAEH